MKSALEKRLATLHHRFYGSHATGHQSVASEYEATTPGPTKDLHLAIRLCFVIESGLQPDASPEAFDRAARLFHALWPFKPFPVDSQQDPAGG